MSKLAVSLAIVSSIIMLAPQAKATDIWSQNFSDVSNWGVVYDPGGGSSITSSGGLGAMYVDKPNNQAAFAPNQSGANFIPFNRTNASDYTFNFTVDHLTWSTSYDIAMDEFNSSKGYVNTVWQIYPAQFTSTDTGARSSNLGGFTWDSNASYLIPKVNVHTGDGGQTVYFSKMSMALNTVPEPASTVFFLLGSGLFGFRVLRKRK